MIGHSVTNAQSLLMSIARIQGGSDEFCGEFSRLTVLGVDTHLKPGNGYRACHGPQGLVSVVSSIQAVYCGACELHR